MEFFNSAVTVLQTLVVAICLRDTETITRVRSHRE